MNAPQPLARHLFVGLVATTACSPSGGAESALPTARVEATVAEIVLSTGARLPYEHGSITVPMNRSSASDAEIAVEFHRFTAHDSTSGAPAVFLLRGGPGGDGLSPLLNRDGYYEAQLAPYAEHADLIVPGQRGFGRSTPTPCPEGDDSLSTDVALDPTARREAVAHAMALCRATHEAGGVDLDGFDVMEAAEDVADLARSLGYDEIQLVGSSFGSHWAIAVARLHPDLVARVTLAAVEGPDHTFDAPSGVASALTRIAEAAERSGAWGAAMPDLGLIPAYHQLLGRSAERPFEVPVVDSDRGDTTLVSLGPTELRSLIHGYESGTQFPPQIGRWPNDIVRLVHEDFGAAATEILDSRRRLRLRDAAFYQYECTSGISAERFDRLSADPAVELVGNQIIEGAEMCEAWGVEASPWFGESFVSDVPALLVHGSWDTSTPIGNAHEVRRHFATAKLITVHGGSHGALLQALDTPAFADGLGPWLRLGVWASLPDSLAVDSGWWDPR